MPYNLPCVEVSTFKVLMKWNTQVILCFCSIEKDNKRTYAFRDTSRSVRDMMNFGRKDKVSERCYLF